MSAPADPTVRGASGSYWGIVGAQLRKNAVAMTAWAVVKGLIFIAISESE